MNLFLLQYNNYYNRVVKKYDTIQEYSDYIIDQAKRDNFDPGDGVDTKIIVNYDGKTQPDYIILTEGNGAIISRWFVLDAHFIRKGQYEVSLHRDVIADNYDKVIEAPCFIEKATLKSDDPMIFNNEDMSFNQIKTSEYLLKDETETPWIVGYIASNSFPEETEIRSTFVDAGNPDIKINGIENWELYDYSELATNQYKYYMGNANIKYAYTFSMKHEYSGWIPRNPFYAIGQIVLDKNGNVSTAQGSANIPGKVETLQNGSMIMKRASAPSLPNLGNYVLTSYDKMTTGWGAPDLFVHPEKGYVKKVQDATSGQMGPLNINLESEFGIYTDSDPLGDSFRTLNGKTILDTKTNILYKINITTGDSYYRYTPSDVVNEGMNSIFPRNLSVDYNNDEAYIMSGNGGIMEGLTFFQFEGTSYKVSLVQQEINITTTVLKDNTRTHLTDAPYDMFCMPYNEGIEITDNGKTIKNSAFAALNMSIAVGARSGKAPNPDKPGELMDVAGRVYDIQLLPYCPLRKVIKDGKIDVTGIKKNAITSSDGTKVFTYMLWCDSSNFSFDIPYEITVGDAKISNECDLYRLCSPNYGAAFDFSAAKNDGVSVFNVDATYKPFNPYIHINPDFKGLYGSDYNDVRGLIVGGDFSLTQLSSEWANYVMTNKNYENAFDRNIKSMDLKNQYQKTADIANAVTGTLVGAGAAGLGANALGAGVKGSITGGIMGAAGSAVAGYFDVKMNEELRKEEMANAKDQFGYQMQNIQAIPYALAKTSALTANNKLFPFIEYYTCTDIERNALINKIKYNGMTVMRIGTIHEFLQPDESYIKGRIIRLDNLGDDFHMAATIASELNQGIFI